LHAGESRGAQRRTNNDAARVAGFGALATLHADPRSQRREKF
jgi:hypothetical protein